MLILASCIHIQDSGYCRVVARQNQDCQLLEHWYLKQDYGATNFLCLCSSQQDKNTLFFLGLNHVSYTSQECSFPHCPKLALGKMGNFDNRLNNQGSQALPHSEFHKTFSDKLEVERFGLQICSEGWQGRSGIYLYFP